MYVMHPTQLIILVALTCCFLVYALVPHILIENVTPVDDICIFMYPLHCGQPFTDNDSGANETVHEVPFYIHTCSSYICSRTCFNLYCSIVTIFSLPQPLYLYQQPNLDGTDTTVHSVGGTTRTHSYADDSTKVHMTN
jgi:hypothetical protein